MRKGFQRKTGRELRVKGNQLMQPASAMIHFPRQHHSAAHGSVEAQSHVTTRNHSASKSSHIPSVTSGCFSTEGDKGVSMGQKTRGVEPFFPTITVLLGIEKVLGNTHRLRVWRKSRSDPAHPSTNSLCLSLPILHQKFIY